MNLSNNKLLLVLFSIAIALAACETFEPKAPEENELLDGPIEGLSFEESKRFLDGDIAL